MISINELITKVEKLLDDLPEGERKNAVLSIEGKIYNWDQIVLALKKRDSFAEKVALKLRELLE